MNLFTSAAGFAVSAAFHAAFAGACVHRAAETAFSLSLAVRAEYFVVVFFNKFVELLSAIQTFIL